MVEKGAKNPTKKSQILGAKNSEGKRKSRKLNERLKNRSKKGQKVK